MFSFYRWASLHTLIQEADSTWRDDDGYLYSEVTAFTTQSAMSLRVFLSIQMNRQQLSPTIEKGFETVITARNLLSTRDVQNAAA